MYFTVKLTAKLLRAFLKLVLLPFRLVGSLLSIDFGAVIPTTKDDTNVEAPAAEGPRTYFVWALYGLAALQLYAAYLAIIDNTTYWFDQLTAILYAAPIVDIGYLVLLFPIESDALWLLFGLGNVAYAAAYGYVGRRVSHANQLSASLQFKVRAFLAANAVGFVLSPALYAHVMMNEYNWAGYSYGEFYDGAWLPLLGYAGLMGALVVYANRIGETTAATDDQPRTPTLSDRDTDTPTAGDDDASDSTRAEDTDEASDRPDPNAPPEAATDDDAQPDSPDSAQAPAVAAPNGGDSTTAVEPLEEAVTSSSATADDEIPAPNDPSVDAILDGLTADAAADRESAIEQLRTRASTDAESLSAEIERFRAVLVATDDRAVKIAIIDALGAVDDRAVTDLLERVRLDQDQAVSDAACRALRET